MRAFAGAGSVDIQVENPNPPEVIALFMEKRLPSLK